MRSLATHDPATRVLPDHPIVFGVDPGIKHCGWAVLHPGERRAAHGTLRPKGHLRGVDRHLWLLSRLQDLISEWQPGVLAFEEFVWREGEHGEKYVVGRPAMERLIGGIQTLTLYPPYPVLMGLLPSRWGQQLVGQRSHTKEQVAFAVNCRLGTAFRGDRWDNHAADAVGLALVAADTPRLHAAAARR